MRKDIFDLIEGHIPVISSMKKEISQTNGNKVVYSPYFSSILVKDVSEVLIEMGNGGTLHKRDVVNKPILGLMEMKMGNPERGGGSASEKISLPNKLDSNSCKRELYSGSNDLFWNCAQDLEKRYTKTLGLAHNRENYLYFSKEKPNVFIQEDMDLNLNIDSIEENMKKVSALFDNSWIKHIDATFALEKVDSYYVNSDKSKIFQSNYSNSFYFTFYAKDKSGRLIPNRYFYVGKRIPNFEELANGATKAVSELEEILKAPQQTNGIFPSIICGENNGVLFHEVIGHSLEGHRMQKLDFGESNVFKGRLGDIIAPGFVNLVDDPTLREFNGEYLGGYYQYDEEGVKSQKVKLIENGELKNYLHSRQSAGFFRVNSNGHARSSNEIEDSPCPRMGNIVVESSNPVSFSELKKSLISECENQNKPYGLMIVGTSGGLSLPEEGFFQTYPKNVFRIYKNGKEERVKGIYIVGTPHQTLSNLIMMDNNKKIFNGYCGAESGRITQAEIAPNALIKSLEINKIPNDSYSMLKEEIIKVK